MPYPTSIKIGPEAQFSHWRHRSVLHYKSITIYYPYPAKVSKISYLHKIHCIAFNLRSPLPNNFIEEFKSIRLVSSRYLILSASTIYIIP